MKKLVPIALLAALVLAACGGSGAVAATVDGVEITVSDVEGLLDVEGGTVSKDQFAQFLSAEILRVVMVNGAKADYGVEVTDAEVEAEANRIYESERIGEESRSDFVSKRGVTDLALTNFAQQSLVRELVLDEIAAGLERPSQAEIDQQMQTAQWQLTTVCASHILVETEEAAQEVLEILAGGADFATTAAEHSTGPSGPNGGDLGCVPSSEYVPEFRDATLVAPIGEVYDTIVQTFFGFHVVMVSDRTEPDPADVPTEDEVVEVMIRRAATAVLDPWFLELLTNADIVVEEEYGTWSMDPQPRVIAPIG